MKTKTDRPSQKTLTVLQDVLSGLTPLELSEVLDFATTLKEQKKQGNPHKVLNVAKLTPCEKAAKEFKGTYEALAKKHGVPYAALTQNAGLTYEQVAAMFKVDVKTVYAWVDCKMLPVIKVDNWRTVQIYSKAKRDTHRIRPDDLIAFEQQNPALCSKERGALQ